MMTLMSAHLDERTERLEILMEGGDLPTLKELDILAPLLNVEVEDMLAWCLFDEFSVIEERWDVTPQRLAQIAQRYGLESEAKERGVVVEQGPAKAV